MSVWIDKKGFHKQGGWVKDNLWVFFPKHPHFSKTIVIKSYPTLIHKLVNKDPNRLVHTQHLKKTKLINCCDEPRCLFRDTQALFKRANIAFECWVKRDFIFNFIEGVNDR